MIQFYFQMRHGNGIYKSMIRGDCEQQDTYQGQWAHNLKSGFGKQTYFEVGTYNGEWRNG